MIDRSRCSLRSFVVLAALVPAALSLAACSSGEAEAETTALGSFGLVEFHAEPTSPPAEGENAFHVDLHLASSSRPLAGASLDVSAVMPSMGHAAPEGVTVTEIGAGAYEVEHLIFTMPGTWEVRYRAVKDDVTDEAAFRYEVR